MIKQYYFLLDSFQRVVLVGHSYFQHCLELGKSFCLLLCRIFKKRICFFMLTNLRSRYLAIFSLEQAPSAWEHAKALNNLHKHSGNTSLLANAACLHNLVTLSQSLCLYKFPLNWQSTPPSNPNLMF